MTYPTGDQNPEDAIEDRLIYQELLEGWSPHQVAARRAQPIERVMEILERSKWHKQDSANARRSLALARIDELSRIAYELSTKSKDLGGMKTWIELQKREAALTGMDAAQKQDTTVKVELSWVNANRLAYKDKAQLASDIASRASDVSFIERPVNPPQATTMPPAAPSDGHQTDP